MFESDNWMHKNTKNSLPSKKKNMMSSIKSKIGGLDQAQRVGLFPTLKRFLMNSAINMRVNIPDEAFLG